MKTRSGREILKARRRRGRKKLTAQAAILWPFYTGKVFIGAVMEKKYRLRKNLEWKKLLEQKSNIVY